MALNHTVIAAINSVAILLSIPIIAAGIWLSTQADSSCLSVLQWPIIILGVLVLAVALAGFIGAFWRLPMLLLFYLVGMFLLILALAGLVVFIFVVTNSVGPGHLAPSRLFLEYDLDDDSGWLKQRVQGSYQWNRIKECLSSTNVCSDLNQTYTSAQDFFNSMLSPLQSGCCKPPTKCGYTYVNPTNWISPISVTSDIDCMLWSNDQKQLCYSCSSCKAGLLANVKREWRRTDLILVLTLVALVCVYIIGCYAFRAAKTDEIFRRYKQGYT
ncbi:Tetraspanin family protein [Rhynchospora pubera]|uniref:Tetraspanin family protein n=1 Tax=Rhynchospora pubera TaxID=906938 RepID=A0AAV8F1J6_9POAL|nr:Tetraspanin family protein [Rhynchospora pubera]